MITGNTSRDENPTKYREPSFYNQLLQSVSIATDDADEHYMFEIIMCKSLQTYIKVNKSRAIAGRTARCRCKFR